MEEKNAKKSYPQESVYAEYENKYKDISNKKSSLYYIGIILINICTLAFAWIIVGNKDGVEGINNVLGVINWKYILFIFLIILLVLLLQSFPPFISIFQKIRKRRFGTVFLANSRMNYYNSVTVMSRGDIPYALRLHNGGVDKYNSIEVAYLNKFLRQLSLILYSLIFIIIGAIFYFSKINIWCFVAGIIAFSAICIVVIFILLFDVNRDKSISIIGGISKILYRLKLIKDYETFYKGVVNRLFVYSASLKSVKKTSILYIVFNLLIQFLKHFSLFVILQAIDIVGYGALCEVLFKCVVLDLIINIVPTPKGTLIFEVLFISLFNNLFASGYVLWGMVLYRLFDYFVYVILHLIISIFDRPRINSVDAE